MIAVILEVYGAFCLFSLIAFLVWAWFAELRPDLDEPEFDLDDLEKLKKPAGCEQCDSDHEAGEARRPSGAGPPDRTKTSAAARKREPLFQTRKHRPTWRFALPPVMAGSVQSRLGRGFKNVQLIRRDGDADLRAF
jgi:hypothetical protein